MFSSANFTPTMNEISGQKPFKFWCQTVLPLVYDESLSYYELLCKVVDYLNNTINDINTLKNNADSLLIAYTNLQNYVNNYFESADFQSLVNNKLDDMANDGTLSELILEILDKDYVTPQMYGAVGDGVTNDLTAFASAINNSSGKPVFIPSGNYYINGDLQMSAFQTLNGVSASTVNLINARIRINYRCTVSNITLKYTNTSTITDAMIIKGTDIGNSRESSVMGITISNIFINNHDNNSRIVSNDYALNVLTIQPGRDDDISAGMVNITAENIKTYGYVTKGLNIELIYTPQNKNPWITYSTFRNWFINGVKYAIYTQYINNSGGELIASEMSAPIGNLSFINFNTQHIASVPLTINFIHANAPLNECCFIDCSISDYVRSSYPDKNAFWFYSETVYNRPNSIKIVDGCRLHATINDIYFAVMDSANTGIYDSSLTPSTLVKWYGNIFAHSDASEMRKYSTLITKRYISGDLNDFKETGIYHGSAGSTSSYINCPFSSGNITLTVDYLIYGKIRQTLENENKTKIYCRTYDMNTSLWSNWVDIYDRSGITGRTTLATISTSISSSTTVSLNSDSTGYRYIEIRGTRGECIIPGELMDYYGSVNQGIRASYYVENGSTYEKFIATIYKDNIVIQQKISSDSEPFSLKIYGYN